MQSKFTIESSENATLFNLLISTKLIEFIWTLALI